jgi:hypothetical protein
VAGILAERYGLTHYHYERDRLIAESAVRLAGELGIRVIEVDGSRDAEAVAGLVADHFAGHLPQRLGSRRRISC